MPCKKILPRETQIEEGGLAPSNAGVRYLWRQETAAPKEIAMESRLRRRPRPVVLEPKLIATKKGEDEVGSARPPRDHHVGRGGQGRRLE